MTEKKRLLKILKQFALKRGSFTLSSGEVSNYYVDARMITTHPEGAYLIGKIIFEMIKNDDVAAVGGPALGAIPICNAVSLVSYLEGKAIPAFFVRSSAKRYGARKCIEGNIKPASAVVMVEDVITTAGSVLAAIEQVEGMGCQVARVICIVDREGGGREKLANAGYTLEAIFTKADLGV
jgi:orotate phosphoribosyltransferase